MLNPQINMIAIVTSQLSEMRDFYHLILGFKIDLEMEQYIEFQNEGVRFALTTNKVMKDATDHNSYDEESRGQSLELGFKVTTPEEVDLTYRTLIEKGAFGIKEPYNMPWGQRAAFFADPDGNIHEVFCDLENNTD